MIPSPIDRVHTQVSDQSVLGRVVSGFLARLNTRTIEHNTKEVEARSEYMNAVGRLADASLERDRKIARYQKDRDAIIEDDRAEHRMQMELNSLSRGRRLREAKGGEDIAQLEQQAKISDAKSASARAQWGHDAFNQSLPHRQERLEHLFKSGALDAELEKLMRDKDVAKLMGKNAEEAKTTRAETIELLLGELNLEIEAALRTHMNDDVMSALYAFRSRLRALLETEKNRPG